MKKEYQITQSGKDELAAELAELKSRRGAIADKIAEARDYGDLSENAEYDTAREEQGIVETRIAEIEEILTNAKIIESQKGANVVALGTTVELTLDAKTVTYTVVGPVEANPLEGKISNESPIGEALLGKRVGDVVTITTPKGELSYHVATIK
jgi:transcription elongation factor greA